MSRAVQSSARLQVFLPLKCWDLPDSAFPLFGVP
jgi:hypothetical protein